MIQKIKYRSIDGSYSRYLDSASIHVLKILPIRLFFFFFLARYGFLDTLQGVPCTLPARRGIEFTDLYKVSFGEDEVVRHLINQFLIEALGCQLSVTGARRREVFLSGAYL